MAGQAGAGGMPIRPNKSTGQSNVNETLPNFGGLQTQPQTREGAMAGLDYAFQGGHIDEAKRQQLLGQFDTMNFQPQVAQAPAFGAKDFAQNILQHSVGLTPFEQGTDRWNAADVNKDGKINISDATKFLRYEAGLETAGQEYDYGSLATAIKPKSGGRGETAEQYEARDDVKLYNQRMNPVAAQTGEQVYNQYLKNNPQPVVEPNSQTKGVLDYLGSTDGSTIGSGGGGLGANIENQAQKQAEFEAAKGVLGAADASTNPEVKKDFKGFGNDVKITPKRKDSYHTKNLKEPIEPREPREPNSQIYSMPSTSRQPATATPDWMTKVERDPTKQYTMDLRMDTFTNPETGETFQGDMRDYQSQFGSPDAKTGGTPAPEPTAEQKRQQEESFQKQMAGAMNYSPDSLGGANNPVLSLEQGGVPQQPANINTLAAEGIKAAGAATGQGLSFNPQQVSVAGTSASINPANVYGSNVVNSNVVGSNVDASLNDVSGTNVTGSNIAAQQVGGQALSPQVMAERMANTDMSQYMNPYTDQVIKANETDTLRAANMGMDALGAQAQAANAFGGSRHGIAMGEMGRGVTDTLARTSAGLRQAGYQNAQQMAGQDISNNFQSQMANQQGGQFDINTNMQGQLANQGASLQASQQNQQNALQAQGMNQNNALQAAMANQNAGMQGQLSNQGNSLQAALANQSAGMQSGMANQQNALQAALSNQNFNFQGQRANQQAGQQDISNQLQAALANQGADLQGNSQRMGAANQLGQISNLGFNMGQTVNNNLAQQGAMQQALQQAIYDNAQNKFAGYTGQPGQSIGYLGNALGVTPNVGSNTTTQEKGLFDYLTLGASMMGG